MADSLNVVLAQLNLLVGDIDGNAERIITSAKQAFDNQSAHLIVFPELTLTGYPPEDLLIRPSLQARIERALEKILEADLPGYIVVGFPEQVNCSLYNTLALIKGRERLATYHKQCLPNYQVFDERRYSNRATMVVFSRSTVLTLHLLFVKICGNWPLLFRPARQGHSC